MAYRVETITTYKTTVICDDCKKETFLKESLHPLNFDNRMNGALCRGYTFTDAGGRFMNYCKQCKEKHE